VLVSGPMRRSGKCSPSVACGMPAVCLLKPSNAPDQFHHEDNGRNGARGRESSEMFLDCLKTAITGFLKSDRPSHHSDLCSDALAVDEMGALTASLSSFLSAVPAIMSLPRSRWKCFIRAMPRRPPVSWRHCPRRVHASAGEALEPELVSLAYDQRLESKLT
jgi:hypothetical protein